MPTKVMNSCVSPAVRATRRRAFTLIEMLAVITIICMLFAVAVGAFKQAQNAAWKSKARTTARQLAAAWNLRLQADARFPDHSLFSGATLAGDLMFDSTVANMSVLNSNVQNVVYFEQSTDNLNNGLRDPWKQFYHVILDYNYDGQIKNPVDGSIIQANVVVSSDGPGAVKDKIVVW